MNKTKFFQKAKKDGRLCERCGYGIPKRRWKKGHRLCWYCADALKGVVFSEPFSVFEEVRSIRLIKHVH